MSCSRGYTCSRKSRVTTDPINVAINENLEQLSATGSALPNSSSQCRSMQKTTIHCSRSSKPGDSGSKVSSMAAITSSGNGNTSACSRSGPSISCSSGSCFVKPKPFCGSGNVCVVVPEKNSASCGQRNRAQNTCIPSQRTACSRPVQTTCYRSCQQRQEASSCSSIQKDSNANTLKIGTYVHITAIQDKFRPAGQTSIQKIAAVVMYATSDGQYQLGTRKGVIGKLFTRDEMEVRDPPRFTTKDVPDTKINMYEASAMAF